MIPSPIEGHRRHQERNFEEACKEAREPLQVATIFANREPLRLVFHRSCLLHAETVIAYTTIGPAQFVPFADFDEPLLGMLRTDLIRFGRAARFPQLARQIHGQVAVFARPLKS
jgi:hypothetical protein